MPLDTNQSIPRASSAGLTQTAFEPAGVLVVGPGEELTGGMASVVAQTLALAYEGEFAPQLLPLTVSTDDQENLRNRIGRHVRQIGQLSRSIRAFRARIVHIHTCSGFSFFRSLADLLTARRAGCRTVLHIHGAKFAAFFERSIWAQRLAIRWALEAADVVIALSAGWKRELQAMAPRANIAIVENAVASPATSAPVQRPPHAGCRFLLLARMDVWKGIIDLLDACQRLKEGATQFEIVLAGPPGSAGDAITLRREILERDLFGCVRYVGTVQGLSKDHLLRWADVYIQPSHHEGLPISLLEALAYNLPVVATQVGAIPEVIEAEREGLLVPPKRPDLLAEAMRRVAADGNLRCTMAEQSRQLAAARFSLQRLERDLLQIYRNLLQVSGTSGDDPVVRGTPQS